jgi:putative transposase
MIHHEDLQTANMVKNHYLAKPIRDAGWGAFLITLTYKAAWAGHRIVAVHPAFPSQMCSGRGKMVKQGLSVRWQLCPAGGTRRNKAEQGGTSLH